MRRFLAIAVIIGFTLSATAEVLVVRDLPRFRDPRIIKKIKIAIRTFLPKRDDDNIQPPKPAPCPSGTTC